MLESMPEIVKHLDAVLGPTSDQGKVKTWSLGALGATDGPGSSRGSIEVDTTFPSMRVETVRSDGNSEREIRSIVHVARMLGGWVIVAREVDGIETGVVYTPDCVVAEASLIAGLGYALNKAGKSLPETLSGRVV